MAARGRVFIAILMLLALLMAAGCSALPNQMERTSDGRLVYTQGDNIWSWAKADGGADIQLNGKDFARVTGKEAVLTLDEERALTVALNAQNEPVSVEANWGVVLTAADYALMDEALQFHKLAGGVERTVPWVGAVLLIILILAFALAAIRAGTIVDWAKTHGLFSSFNTGTMLFLTRALAVLLAALFLVLLLVLVF